MNEQEQMSQLSALFDNELPPAEAELVIRRVLKDPALRARWTRYALIGACVRHEPIRVSAIQPDVAERVRQQLAMEAVAAPLPDHAIVRYPGERRSWSQFGRGALGGAIAAGVATVAFILMRSLGPQAGPAMQMADVPVTPVPVSQPQAVLAPAAAPALMAATAVDSPPPSYTTPVDNSTQRISGPLATYVVAHSAAASAGRLLPMSAAMSGTYDIAQGTVEMTEAEIGAYR